MTSRSEKFLQGTLNLMRRPLYTLMWRQLYSAMYKLRMHHEMSDWEVTNNFIRIGMFRPLNNRQTKNNADRILYAMISTILHNEDESLVRRYRLLSKTERINFARRTILGTHRRISHEFSDLAPHLVDVQYDEKANPTHYGSYDDRSATIYLRPGVLSSDDISILMNTLAHEYVHVMQMTYHSSLPNTVLRAWHARRQAMNGVAYDRRPIEREAFQIGDIVGAKFSREFHNQSENYRHHEYIPGYLPEYPLNER